MFEKKETFRKAALERLASPERLDEMMQITAPKAWVALGVTGALLVLGLVWAFFGRIPERVTGDGILVPGGSYLQVQSQEAGVVKEIYVEEGQIIEAETQVAAISVTGKTFDIEILQGQLQREIDRNIEETQREESTIAARRTELDTDLKNLQSRLVVLQRAVDTAADAVRRGRAGRLAPAEIARREQALREAEQSLKDAQGEESAMESQWEQFITPIEAQRNTRKGQIANLEDDIKKKTAELEASQFIESPFSGRVTQISVTPGSKVDPGQVVLSLERLDSQLRAVVYVASGEAKNIVVGHTAHISPATVKREEHGSIIATVVDVGKQPATSAGMLSVLANERLVEQYSSAGAPLRVDLELNAHASAGDEAFGEFSGYQWTSGDGPKTRIGSGTQVSATVIIGRKRPIDLVIPVLQEFLPIL